MEIFFAIEPKAVALVLISVFLWVGFGFFLYKLIRWKKDHNSKTEP